MGDYRVYDTRGLRGRVGSAAQPAAPHRARAGRSRPSRDAILRRGHRLKVATRRLAMLCFAAFAVLAGLRAGPTAASSHTTGVAGGRLQHRRHQHRHRHVATSGSGATTTTTTGGASSGTANLGAQQTSQPPVVQSSGS
jgi:hypothetical protein